MLKIVTENIVKLLSILCVITITGLTVIVFTQVFSRFISFSLPGTEELARLLVIWLTFLGSSLAIHEKMHLGVRYFVSLASEKYQRFIDLFIHILMIIFFSIISVYGFKLTMAAMDTTSSTLQLPMGLYYAVIPVSFVFSIYFVVIDILHPNPGSKGEVSL